MSFHVLLVMFERKKAEDDDQDSNNLPAIDLIKEQRLKSYTLGGCSLLLLNLNMI